MSRNVNLPTIMVRRPVRTFPSKSVNIRRNVTLSIVNHAKTFQEKNVLPLMNNIARIVSDSLPISFSGLVRILISW